MMLGVIVFSGYTIAQGFQFVGLANITAISTTFVLNFTPVLVALLGWFVSRERPTPRQWAGMAIALVGPYLFFGSFPTGSEAFGIAVVACSSLGWAFYLVKTRERSNRWHLSGLTLTTLSMTIGALFMFAMAIVVEGWTTPTLDLAWLVVWLALVNTSGAFLIWNTVLRYMKAYELSMLQNTMMIQIPIFALVFLGETVTAGMLIGMVAVFIGVVLVQLR